MADTQEDIDLAEAELELAQAKTVTPVQATPSQQAKDQAIRNMYAQQDRQKQLARKQETASMVNVPNAAKVFGNSLTAGVVPAAYDAAKQISQNPLTAPIEIIQGAASNPFNPAAGITQRSNRDYLQRLSEANPQASAAGVIAGLSDVAANAPAFGRAAISAIDQAIASKLGPKAVQWFNELAESVLMRGANRSASQLQQMRTNGMMDKMKRQLVEKINPGILQSNSSIANKLAQNRNINVNALNQATAISQARNAQIANANATNQSINQMNQMYIKPARQGYIQNLKTGRVKSASKLHIQDRPLEPVPQALPVDPRIQQSATVSSQLEKTMAPGVNRSIARPAFQNSFSMTGAFANLAGRKADLIGYRASQNIAKKALEILQKKTGQNISLGQAVMGKQDVMNKLMAISQMQPDAAAAFSYAESLVNPTFRLAWMEAQNDSGNQ